MTRTPCIATLFGTRPEAIKLAPVIRVLGAMIEAGTDGRLVNVNSGQHADLVRSVAELFEIRIHHDLDVGRSSQTATDVCAATMTRFDAVLSSITPDLVLVQGDTTTALAGALAAFHRGIPVGHIEAGLRSGAADSPFPEEMNRRVISRIAALHFAATRHNVDTLRSEGVDDAAILLTGNPVVDAVAWVLESAAPAPRADDLLRSLQGKRLVVFTTHRRESFGAPMAERLRALSRFVNAHDDVVVVFPVHPNPDVRRTVAETVVPSDRLRLVEPLGYADFIHLLAAAWLVVSDSGGVQEEAPCFGKPVLVIREHTDRPEAIEAGIGRLVGESPEALIEALRQCYADTEWTTYVRAVPNPFGTPGSAERIARAAYTFAGATRSSRFRTATKTTLSRRA